MICGSWRISRRLLPCATRSGQKATWMSSPARREVALDELADAGKIVLRRIRICPFRSCAEHASIAFFMPLKLGVRCWSTGVPITSTMKRHSDMCSGVSLTSSLPPGSTLRSSSGAPSSENGISPRRILATVLAFVS
jgi:hypothetical protein